MTGYAAPQGVWTITVESPKGPEETRLELAFVDGVLTGIHSALGLSGAISKGLFERNSGKISWVSKIKKPLPLNLKFQGTVVGNEMHGKVRAAVVGSFLFHGKKISQA